MSGKIHETLLNEIDAAELHITANLAVNHLGALTEVQRGLLSLLETERCW